MEAKSKHYTLVGYDDRLCLVLYYNAETRKVLTLRNFHFIDASDITLEHLIIMLDDMLCKGESRSEGST